MGCINSKKTKLEFVVPPSEGESSPTGAGLGGPQKAKNDGLGRLLPTSKTPPTRDEARQMDVARMPRLSVKYQSKELSGRGSASRRSSTPFDRARIGTHTRHGLMPGARGFSAAKINQDRGVVCWPFNGSYNQALLCVFDGHGSKGERASEFCMKSVPELLEADSAALKADPPAALSRAVIKTDELLLGSPELGRLAMTCGTTSTVVYFHGTEVWTACSGDSRAVKVGVLARLARASCPRPSPPRMAAFTRSLDPVVAIPSRSHRICLRARGCGCAADAVCVCVWARAGQASEWQDRGGGSVQRSQARLAGGA